MNKTRLTINILLACAFLLAAASLAQAQLSRTWVSGVGDDINPCTRTAPCKTFSSAMSRTSINGEIDVLDSGGFGAVSINKSLTIDGTSTNASVLVTAGAPSGIGIYLPDMSGNDPLKIVRLRNISILGNGLSGSVGTRTALRAIFVSSSNTVPIRVDLENVRIDGFYGEGILYASNGGHLTVNNSIIRNNATAGIKATNSFGTNLLYLTITNSRLDHNGQEGLRVENYVRATMTNSSASDNGLNGVTSISNGGPSEIILNDNTIANNGQNGVFSINNTSTIRVANTTISHNVSNGLAILNGALLCSNGRNHITLPTQSANCAFGDQ